MPIFQKLFGGKKTQPEPEIKRAKIIQPTKPASSVPETRTEKKEPLTYVFTPALCLILTALEKRKGSPLTVAEVEATRDKAICVVQTVAAKRALDAQRKYRDLDPRDIWNEWQLFRQLGLEGWSAAYVDAMKNMGSD